MKKKKYTHLAKAINSSTLKHQLDGSLTFYSFYSLRSIYVFSYDKPSPVQCSSLNSLFFSTSKALTLLISIVMHTLSPLIMYCFKVFY